jgi:hypothetical protein
VTALGLALSRNFLALPIMVLGLWKFGFPETLMHLFLSIYPTPEATKMKRVADFLKGAGTALHHGAASMIISMVVVGVIPASRFVLDCSLILMMQHWFVMLNYYSPSLYCAIELVLEYYFEWIVFCKYSPRCLKAVDVYNSYW